MHNAQFPGFGRCRLPVGRGTQTLTRNNHHRNNLCSGGYINGVAANNHMLLSNQSPTGSGSFSSGQLPDNGTVRREMLMPVA